MLPALRSLTFCAAFACALPAHAACSDLWDWLGKGCRRVADTWRDGNDEILVSGYSWHIPGTWTQERLAELNQDAWGGGYGRTVDRDKPQVGLGYTAMIIQRPDIASGVPVPVVLPLLTLRYQQANLVTTYIPNLGGGINHGSVLYVFARFTLDTKYNR